MCGNPNYYKSFEETIADEKERLRLRNEDELIDLTPEEEEAYFAAWWTKEEKRLANRPSHNPLSKNLLVNKIPDEEYQAIMNEAIRNFDWEKACKISGMECNRTSISFLKTLGFANGAFD